MYLNLQNSTNDIQRGVGHFSTTKSKFFCNQFYSFLDKVNTHQKILNNFSSEKQFPWFPKINFKYNGHKVYLALGNLHCLLKHLLKHLSYLSIAQNFRRSRCIICITCLVPFPDLEKLLKQVNGEWTCRFHKC